MGTEREINWLLHPIPMLLRHPNNNVHGYFFIVMLLIVQCTFTEEWIQCLTVYQYLY